MDVVIICNGLGNQMSQYAFYLQKKKINKSTKFIFDLNSKNEHNGYELYRVFGIQYKDTVYSKFLYFLYRLLGMKKNPFLSIPIVKLLNILGFYLITESKTYDFDESMLNTKKGINFYYGGWHSEKYTKDIREDVIDTFKFQTINIGKEVLNIAHEISSCNSVSLHIRRGDFLNIKNIKTFGLVCNKEYYQSAINQMYLLMENPHFYIFSNDIKWVKENFIAENITVVEINKSSSSWKDMYLISLCKNNINSNSSFSWWGAYLNPNINKKVIVPKYFINNLITKDVYPENWIKLSDY
jgi:hypothetical protein